MSTTFDNQVDDLLTKEETADAKDAAPPETETDQAPASEPASTERSEPETEPRAGTGAKPLVPVPVVAGMRQTIRDLRQDLAEQSRELETLRQELAQSRQPKAESGEDDGDDDEPLTRADLRKIEAQRAAQEAQRQQQQQERDRQTQTAFAKSDLAKATPAQAQLLAVAENYLSPRDVARICQSKTPLTTAVTIAEARLQAFGTDEELAKLEAVSGNHPRTTTKPRGPSARDEPSPASDDDDEPPQIRAVLDMFRT